MFEPGDQIEIITKSRKIVDLKVTDVGESTISGISRGQTVSLELSEISDIRYKEYSAPRSIGAAALAILAAAGLYIIISFERLD